MAHPTKPTQNGFSYEKGLPHQENAVKSILAVFDGAEPKNDNVIEVIIEKNRSGARGTVELLFIKEYNKFSSLSPREEFG